MCREALHEIWYSEHTCSGMKIRLFELHLCTFYALVYLRLRIMFSGCRYNYLNITYLKPSLYIIEIVAQEVSSDEIQYAPK
jgi:hypothetical protein